MYHRFFQRAILKILLFCFAFVFVVSAIAIPRPVRAQLFTEEAPGPLLTAILREPIQQGWWRSIWSSALVGIINATTLFAQQMAYDMAVGLSTGCKGEQACAFAKNPKEYFTDVAFDAAGEFIGNLAGPWESLGLDLCSPRIPDVGLSIALGLAEQFQRPAPRCDFAQTVQNWQSVVAEARDPQALLRHLSVNFDPGQTDLGQAFKANEAFRIQYEAKKLGEFTKRLEGGGILPKESIIGGGVKTPAQVMRENFNKLARTGEASTQPPSALALAGAIGGGDVWLAVGTTVLSTFVNTLAARMLKMAIQGLFSLGAGDETRPDLMAPFSGGARGRRGGAGLSAAASALLAPQIRTSTGAYDFLSELGACPQDRKMATQFNCAIDQQFMVAIQRASAGSPLTVKEAAGPAQGGYLDRAKPFGYVQPRGTPPQEPDYTAGYSYSSMKKLRLLRIIPIGWELAAERILADGTPATLGDVLNGYRQEGDTPGCQGPGAGGVPTDPGESRFCGLVDENWVLKAPVASCGARVWGALLDGSGIGRQEICADVRHCVSQDELGNCHAWGYCTREKNIWRFDGDACDSQYASCDTFRKQTAPPGATVAAAQQVSLLENTLNFGICNADNAGCTGYLTSQTPSGASGALAWSDSSPLRRLYLDKDAGACTAAADGCREFITSGSANLIQNPGFERDEAAPTGEPDSWTPAQGHWISDGTQAFEGRGALKLNMTAARHTLQIPIQGSTTYTLSMYAKGGDASAPDDQALAMLTIKDGSGTTLTVVDEASSCVSDGGGSGYTALVFAPYFLAGNNAATYVRQSCTLTVPAQARSAELQLKKNTGAVADVYVDAVQLESGTTATNYRESYASDAQKAYFRVPPAYLGCTGEVTDRAECATYSRLCRREEVGCERYTPLEAGRTGASAGSNGAVPGIVTAADRCPSECLGYNTYIKQASTFEPKLAGENLYLIIPSRTRECSAQDNGCDEFTNLQTEQREYYSELRACEQPAPDSQTYYTWEGSDTAGYQLKTWSLKRIADAAAISASTAVSGLCSAPSAGTLRRCTNGYQSVCSSGADCVVNTITSTATPARPPCTNYQVAVTAAGGINVTCTDISMSGTSADTVSLLTPPAGGFPLGTQAFCTKADSLNPDRSDCRAFYDAAGNIFYRLLSRTILSTSECRAYRWTGFPTLPEVTRTPAATRVELEREACTHGHGSWNIATNQCIYLGVPSQSRSCSSQVSGCRGYKGNTGSNVEVVLTENFEGGVANWDAPGGTTVSSSSEALTVSGHSLRVQNAAPRVAGAPPGPGSGAAYNLAAPSRSSPQIQTGQTFLVSFIAKGTLGANIESVFRNNSGTSPPTWSLGSVSLTPDWRLFQLGPVTISDLTPSICTLSPATPATAPTRCSAGSPAAEVCTVPVGATSCTYLDDPELFFRNAAVNTGGNINFYLDDISLRRVSDTIYLVKNSWSIPDSCNTLPAELGGGRLRGAMVGCASYNDRANTTHNLKSFNALCRNEAVGCQDLIDTQGSDNQAAQQFNTTNSGTCRGSPGECRVDTNGDGVVNSSDTVVCTVAAGETSCSYSRNIQIDDWTVPADEHRYVVVDPTKACQAAQKGCRALGRSDSSGAYTTAYLKDDPNLYSSTLCQFEAEGCATWQRTDQSLAYFKDPGALGCEWRTNVNIGGTSYSGWFRKNKQAVVDDDKIDRREECSGYGTWNNATKTCVAPGGASITRGATPPAPLASGIWADWPASCTPGTCTGAACANCARLCNSGAQGTWQEDAPTGVGATNGTCVADTPCYGSVQVTGTDDLPRVAINVTGTYLIGGTTFGIRRNGDALYQNRSGDCPQDQATCTEFIDPTDRTQSSRGQAYYFKENARLDEARRACNGQVSRKEGCVLFDKTENVQKLWGTEQTYYESDNLRNNPGGRVAAQFDNRQMCRGSSTAINNGKVCVATVNDASTQVLTTACTTSGGRCQSVNDTNIVLRVLRDRECAEWFQCASAQWVWDPTVSSGGGFRAVCALVARCDELNPTRALPSGSIVQCGSWSPNPVLTQAPNVSQATCEVINGAWLSRPTTAGQLEYYCDLATGSASDKNACEQLGGVWQGQGASPSETNGLCMLGRLTDRTYLLRDRRFQGHEYTGYSVPNIYAIDQLREVNIRSGGSNVFRLAHPTGQPCSATVSCPTDQTCTSAGCAVNPNGSGEPSAPAALPNIMAQDQLQCRGYPETSSPFPNTAEVRGEVRSEASAFNNASRCSQPPSGTPSVNQPLACECSYIKAEYGGQPVYRRQMATDLPPRICVGGSATGSGSVAGKTCVPDADTPTALQVRESECTTGGGACQGLGRTSTAVGWQGYCLERDSSRNINAAPDQNPCLTWWPVDRLSGAPDVYNQFDSAGYIPANDRQFYCIFASGAENQRVVFDERFSVADSYINVLTKRPSGADIYQHDIQGILVEISDMNAVCSDPIFCPQGEIIDTARVAPRNPATIYGPMGAFTEKPSWTRTTGEDWILGVRNYRWAYDFEDENDPSGVDNNHSWWWWGADDGNGLNMALFARLINTDTSSGGSPLFVSSLNNVQGIHEGDTGMGLIATWNSFGGMTVENFDDATTSNDSDQATTIFKFNSTTKKLEYIRFGFYNDGNHETELLRVRVLINTYPHCTEVTQIDQLPASPGSAPQTNRFWAGSRPIIHSRARAPLCNLASPRIYPGTTSPTFCVPKPAVGGNCALNPPSQRGIRVLGYDNNLRQDDIRGCWACPSMDDNVEGGDCLPPERIDYSYSLEPQPWGASTSTEAPTSVPPDHPWFLNHNLLESAPPVGPLDAVPFAGWPYGCETAETACSVHARALPNVPLGGGGENPVVPLNAFESTSDPNTPDAARNSFSQLFARRYQSYQWMRPTDTSYTLRGVSDLAAAYWDNRTSGTAPAVNSVGAGFNGLEELSQGFTVNDKYAPEDVVQGADGFMAVTMKFFAWANSNQMPIRSIAINWGDGLSSLTGQGLYRNARGRTGSGAGTSGCNNSDFGTLLATQNDPKSCFEGYYKYDYIYTCDRLSPSWRAGSACPVADFRDRYAGCCVFKPAVQVRDNWDICVGVCPGEPQAVGCRDDECYAEYDPDGAVNTDQPWIPFQGVIAVAPRVRE
ncbi:MAG: hypothetical protein UX98_C0003G0023 [Parcubacteria group bacterium GW2011_GWA2_47_26]|nr:MAG: hypothetical protein UX98_C0003G0023 [Parcubacteria group bacterium GW2011_GWA2_47_26]